LLSWLHLSQAAIKIEKRDREEKNYDKAAANAIEIGPFSTLTHE